MRLFLKHINCWLFKCGFVLSRPLPTLTLDPIAFNGRQNTCRLRTAHHANPRIGPTPHETRRISPPGHPIITSPKRATHNHRDLRHRSCRHSRHHLGTVARNAFILVLTTHHKTCDVLQEHQRNLTLRTQLNKMRTLLGSFGKQHTVVGDDPNGTSLKMRKARYQRLTKTRFEFVKA